jgi:F-type H+-transporting ATPase subunit gamma
MSSIQEIKRRIDSVKNTRQITKAMELVSATKMRKSQEVALLARPYAVESLKLLGELARHTSYKPPLMQRREEIKKTAVVVIASDRGLAGSLNANIFRHLEREMSECLENPDKYTFFCVGKKSREFLERKKITPQHALVGCGDYVTAKEAEPISDTLINGYLEGKWDRVLVVSTHFRSTLNQEVFVREVLPIDHEKITELIKAITPEEGRFSEDERYEETGFEKHFEYLIEPNPKLVLDTLAPRLVAIEIYHTILEANASEHSARMVAMKSASENAEELKDDLTLIYNKSRQAGITREVSEITAGAEALN